MTSFFKKKNIVESSDVLNPFIKPGDIVYITTKSGRYKIVEISENDFKATPEPPHYGSKILTCKWSEFKRWSSKTSISK